MSIGFVQREACPLCRSTSAELLCDLAFDAPPMAPFLEHFYGGRILPGDLASGRYRVRRCGDCDFLYQDQILNEAGMQALYQDWIDQQRSLQKKINTEAGRFRQYAGQVQTISRLFAKPPHEIRVLDFGMGWGYWCRMAQAHGFDACGFELSASRRKHAEQLGVTVVDRLDPDKAAFDFVYANQVFEHLPDPQQALRDLCQQLKPDGVIYLRVPDGRGVARRLQRSAWSAELDAIHPLEHINCFTRDSLIQLAATEGLRPIQAPLQLQWGSLRGGIRREIADRWFTTHLMFRR